MHGSGRAGDGKVVLCRNKLKQLRQHRGLSQEKLAEQCQARGLRISMPSIKRAETSHPILYRTASELARFFDVDFSTLLAEGIAERPAPSLSPMTPTPTSVLAERRKLVFLSVQLHVDAGEEGAQASQSEAFQRCCEAGLKQYGGMLYQREGARVIAVFGALDAQGDEIRRSLFCALDLHQRLARNLAGRLQAAIGIVCGEGILQDCDASLSPGLPAAVALEGTVLSIARLDWVQQIAKTGQVLVTDMVQQAVGDEFNFEQIPAAPRRYSVRRLYALNHCEYRASATGRLVGRRREMAIFEALLRVCATERQGQVVYLRGMAGSGKTRLTQAWLERAEQLGYRCQRVAVVDCQGVIHSTVGPPNVSLSDPETAAAKTAGLLQKPPASLAGRELSASDGQGELLANLEQRLSQQAAMQPIVICVEDIQCGDRRALELLLRLANGIQNLPVIVLLTSRLADDPLDAAWRGALMLTPLTIADLPALRREEARELASHFPWVESGYRELCILRAEGNPLFLEQLLHSEQYSNGILPHSLQMLIQAQLHALPQRDRQALRAAAVIGRWFEPACLRYLIGVPDYQCDELVRNHLVKRAEDGFVFSHQLVRQGVYDSLPQKTQHSLHAACAKWFAGVSAEQEAFHLARI